ncbi:MAG TPA: ribosome small subunit-dependent GTPase A [Desulfosarcina sp.]|nr:ribosome small subunit-dependent GTPase A [Desulfosarcina sp.]
MNTLKSADTANHTSIDQSLANIGWDVFFQSHLDKLDGGERRPARVVGTRRNSFYLSQGKEAWLATVSGRLNHRRDGLYPVVGDWVSVSDTVICDVLPRKNALYRGAAGARGKRDAAPAKAQVIASNLDTVFVVCGLDRDYNLRRIERYVALVYNCGLKPAVVLTKADLHDETQRFADEVETVALGIPVHIVSAADAMGLDQLEAYLAPGQTATLIGSSGAGKSTLVNRLYGRPVQAVGEVGEGTGKGRHTTTSRDLIVMPQGGMVIDNPGIREIAFWDGDGGIEYAFAEIEALAAKCRFSDCSHMHEPGCRVTQAIAEGAIAQDRLDGYHKTKRELMYLSDRQRKTGERIEKERWKAVALKIRAHKRGRPKG